MEIRNHQPFAFEIDLPVRNEWENIDLLRTSVQNCFAAVFKDIDGSHAVAMVTGELLENAMKYGSWRKSAQADDDEPQLFRLRVEGARGHVRITVQNPVSADDPGVRRLIETIEWIDGFDSPADAYRARLIEIAQTNHDLDSSELGLVRVAYEGDCRLSAVIEDGILTVTAAIEL